jgi:hypothetical protein
MDKSILDGSKESSNLNDERVQCAWCLAEKGEPAGNGSHGICRKHAAILLMRHRELRASNLARS